MCVEWQHQLDINMSDRQYETPKKLLDFAFLREIYELFSFSGDTFRYARQ